MFFINIFLILEAIGLKTASLISRHRQLLAWILMISFALVMGFREDVGVDYEHYVEIYDNPLSDHRASLEPFWIFFCDTLRQLGFKSQMFFLLTSLFIVYCYYYGIRKLSPDIYISFIVFIACGLYDETANTVRQCCAQGLIFASTPLLIDKRWKSLLIIWVTAVFLHYSAIVGMLIMLIFQLRIPRIVWLVGVGVSFLFGGIFMGIFADYLTLLSLAVDKYHYDPNSFDAGVSSGLLRYAYNLIGLIIIYLYPRLIKQNKWVYYYCNLTLLGVCMYNVFYMFMVMNRLTRYCFPFIMILFPYIIYCFRNHSKYISMAVLSLILLVFVLKSDLEIPYSLNFNLL